MSTVYLVTSLTFSDGHVWHQVPVVSVPQGRRPPAHNHLARPEAGQDRPGGDHWTEHAPVLLQGVQPRGERVPGVLSLPDGQHVVPLLIPGVVAAPVGLYQPLGLHIGDALLQLELNKREDLKRNPGVHKWLETVDALVPSGRKYIFLSRQKMIFFCIPVIHQRIGG